MQDHRFGFSHPGCHNPLLAVQPDSNPLVSVVNPQGTFRFKAGRGITHAAIGKVALIDFENNTAVLREHLPRPIGTLVGIYGEGRTAVCDVQVGFDPYKENREALSKIRELESELDDIAEEQDELNEQIDKLTGDLAAQVEETSIVQAQLVKAQDEAKKALDGLTAVVKLYIDDLLQPVVRKDRPNSIFGVDWAKGYPKAETAVQLGERMHQMIALDLETFPRFPGRTTPDRFPTVMNSHPFSFLARSYSATPPKPAAVPHVVLYKIGSGECLIASNDCPYIYPSKEAAEKAILDNPNCSNHGDDRSRWVAQPYDVTKAMHRLARDNGFEPAVKVEPVVEMWTTGDGRRIPVTEMSNPHLYYAIAKIHRGEYPDSKCREVGLPALQKEVLRRLAPVPGLTLSTELTQAKRELEWERDRRVEMGKTNTRLAASVDALKNEAVRERKAAETACAETMKLREELAREQAKNRNQQKMIEAGRGCVAGLQAAVEQSRNIMCGHGLGLEDVR